MQSSCCRICTFYKCELYNVSIASCVYMWLMCPYTNKSFLSFNSFSSKDFFPSSAVAPIALFCSVWVKILAPLFFVSGPSGNETFLHFYSLRKSNRYRLNEEIRWRFRADGPALGWPGARPAAACAPISRMRTKHSTPVTMEVISEIYYLNNFETSRRPSSLQSLLYRAAFSFHYKQPYCPQLGLKWTT